MRCTSIFSTIIFIALMGIKITESHRRFGSTKEERPRTKPRQFNGINGGDKAKEGQFTYAVSLQLDGTDICGGGIIKNRHIVTAAHCVIDETGKFFSGELSVLTNVINVYADTISENKIKVEKVYALKEFNIQNVTDYGTDRVLADIAVLKLAEPVGSTIDSYSTKLKLPEKVSYVGVSATIVGYGWDMVRTYTDRISKKTYESGQSSGQLRHAKAQVLSNEKCSDLMNAIRDSNICAQMIQRQQGVAEGACSGDSGGPLAYDGTLIGVLSTSPFGCQETRGSAVYTRVSSYLDFIGAAVQDNVTEEMRTKDYLEESD